MKQLASLRSKFEEQFGQACLNIAMTKLKPFDKQTAVVAGRRYYMK